MTDLELAELAYRTYAHDADVGMDGWEELDNDLIRHWITAVQAVRGAIDGA